MNEKMNEGRRDRMKEIFYFEKINLLNSELIIFDNLKKRQNAPFKQKYL